MTKRLYLDDSYLRACTAHVCACTKDEDAYWVELDQTILFPEGGGQPHDTGTIGGISVLDVQEEGERVRHKTDAPLEVGAEVEVLLCWQRRFDHMQQHAGEHLLSYAAKTHFGACNVGFHMASSYCTVDFDMPFTQEQLLELEVRTNELIVNNLPVSIAYVSGQELEALSLRKKAAGLEGSIRIVYMQDADSCTCCGTHVKQTGEIGVLKITGAEHYKGGERLTFACGGRALLFMQQVQQVVEQLARRFSCKIEDVSGAVEKTQQALFAAKQEHRVLTTKLNAYLQEELLAGATKLKRSCLIVRALDVNGQQLRPLALALCEKVQAVVLLVAAQDASIHYVLACSQALQLDAGELIQAVNAALGGKGGGRGTLAQGSAKKAGGLQETLAQLEGYFSKRLASV